MDRYIKRLTEEWLQHDKIIVAIDFDDTVAPWRFNDQAECNKVIAILKEVKLVGALLVIFTACSTDRYSEIEKYCESVGLNIDSINKNPINLPYGNQNKVYANIFIDDRAGMEEAIEILKESMYRVRSAKYGANLTTQNVEF